MKSIVNLHPKNNSGESAQATVAFENQVLSLTLETTCYGTHNGSLVTLTRLTPWKNWKKA